MEYVFSIMMTAMGCGLLLWAGLSFLSGKILLASMYANAAKTKDKKLYARQFAKLIALIACSFLLSALVGLAQQYLIAVIVFVVALVFAIRIGSRLMKKATE